MIKKIFYTILTCLAIVSCTKGDLSNNNENSDTQYEAKSYLKYIMDEIYYWSDSNNPEVNSIGIDIFEYFNRLLAHQDRWSWMETGKEYNESETGIYTSYGAALGQAIEYYGDYDVKIRYVFKNSPFDKAGVKRGWTITAINNTDIMTLIREDLFYKIYNQGTNTFTFRNLDGETITKTITPELINTRSVLSTQVFTNNEVPNLPHPVGYLNYYTFNNNMTSDISEAIDLFNKSGIKDLILDLRYNGGGSAEACAFLANSIAPASANGKILSKRRHNSKYSDWDERYDSIEYINRNANALDLSRLYIISGEGTASASEIIINGLSPFMEIIQVGDTTYGKPNGMYVFAYPEEQYETADYIFLPICFYSVNANGVGDYENGIYPTNYRPDDLYHDFNENEDLIKSCLYNIINGSFPDLPSIKTHSTKGNLTKGNKYRINQPNDNPNYGKYVALPLK